MVTALNIKEEIRSIPLGSVVMVIFPPYKVIGHLKHYEGGIDLVP